MSFESLRNKVKEIENKVVKTDISKSARDIIFFQNLLIESNTEMEFDFLLADLSDSLKDFVYNKDHGFTGLSYKISWEFLDKKRWCFTVTNLKYQSKKLLIHCPEVMRSQFVENLGQVKEIYSNIKKNLY